ncbi:hypothetical protein [Marinospirillum perlucidum]|uniref:hypothetical protein n=1 Tax=Marinospirillum perlucidum TaxID=1982602 RepID=UPI000DF26035|nr:hypothetical protein [Marinospirillum perlucidum]
MKICRLVCLVLLAGFASWIFFSSSSLPPNSLEVEFINSSEVMIDRIQLDFGYAQGQSQIQTLRLAPGEARRLLLNHQPGAGFNVQVNFADGVKQDFCANRGEQGSHQKVILQR